MFCIPVSHQLYIYVYIIYYIGFNYVDCVFWRHLVAVSGKLIPSVFDYFPQNSVFLNLFTLYRNLSFVPIVTILHMFARYIPQMFSSCFHLSRYI